MTLDQISWPPLDDAIANSARQLDVGCESNFHQTPEVLCLLTREGAASVCARLRRTSEESYTFKDAVCWHDLLIIGWGNAIYVIRLGTLEVTRHNLGSYFGYIYNDTDICLVASAECIVRLNTDGSPRWVSEPLGIDGVTFSMVDRDYICGDGEWDPPGGWRPFRLSTETGEKI